MALIHPRCGCIHGTCPWRLWPGFTALTGLCCAVLLSLIGSFNEGARHQWEVPKRAVAAATWVVMLAPSLSQRAPSPPFANDRPSAPPHPAARMDGSRRSASVRLMTTLPLRPPLASSRLAPSPCSTTSQTGTSAARAGRRCVVAAGLRGCRCRLALPRSESDRTPYLRWDRVEVFVLLANTASSAIARTLRYVVGYCQGLGGMNGAVTQLRWSSAQHLREFSHPPRPASVGQRHSSSHKPSYSNGSRAGTYRPAPVRSAASVYGAWRPCLYYACHAVHSQWGAFFRRTHRLIH